MSYYEIQGFYIPDRMAGGIERYVNEGIIPGSFLSAVISNDLMGACSYADDENFKNIQAYAAYFYNEVPRHIWGSGKAMEVWAKACAERREGEK